MNRLIVIGWLGCSRAYLNMTPDEAMAAHVASGESAEDPIKDDFTFDKCFYTYEAGPCEG